MPRTPTHSFMCLNPLKPGRPYNMGIVIGCEAPPVPRDPITTISVFFFFFNKNQNQIELRKHTSYEEHNINTLSSKAQFLQTTQFSYVRLTLQYQHLAIIMSSRTAWVFLHSPLKTLLFVSYTNQCYQAIGRPRSR